MLRDALRPKDPSNGDRPHTLRSLPTSDLEQVLRQYERERKGRTRVITIRSNLMGKALQIPFAPVWRQVKACRLTTINNITRL